MEHLTYIFIEGPFSIATSMAILVYRSVFQTVATDSFLWGQLKIWFHRPFSPGQSSFDRQKPCPSSRTIIMGSFKNLVSWWESFSFKSLSKVLLNILTILFSGYFPLKAVNQHGKQDTSRLTDRPKYFQVQPTQTLRINNWWRPIQRSSAIHTEVLYAVPYRTISHQK